MYHLNNSENRIESNKKGEKLGNKKVHRILVWLIREMLEILCQQCCNLEERVSEWMDDSDNKWKIDLFQSVCSSCSSDGWRKGKSIYTTFIQSWKWIKVMFIAVGERKKKKKRKAPYTSFLILYSIACCQISSLLPHLIVVFAFPTALAHHPGPLSTPPSVGGHLLR